VGLRLQRVCCTVGKFNAFHIGHRKLIEEARKRCGNVKVISIRGKGIELLSDRERREVIRDLGVEVIDIPFSKVKDLSPEEFFKLLKEFGCSKLIVGKDWRFGRGRSAGVEEALRLGREFGIEVIPVDTVEFNGEKVGTSRIFYLLSQGNVEEANELLGFPFFVIGKVVEGRKLGRKIGFPTLNVDVGRELPLKRGVYVVRLSFDGKSFYGVANYGVRPTFGTLEPLLEVHVPEENLPSLYGKEVKVEFLKFLRPEISFSSVEELGKQIKLDVRKLKRFLEERVGR